MVMYALIPPLPTEPTAKPKPVLPPNEVTRRAALLTVITGSYAFLYLIFGWSNVHTPIYIALYVSSLDLSRGSAAAKGILAANVAAGLLAMLLYQLTMMAPYVPFVAVMILTVNLGPCPDDHVQGALGSSGQFRPECADDPLWQFDPTLQRWRGIQFRRPVRGTCNGCGVGNRGTHHPGNLFPAKPALVDNTGELQ